MCALSCGPDELVNVSFDDFTDMLQICQNKYGQFCSKDREGVIAVHREYVQHIVSLFKKVDSLRRMQSAYFDWKNIQHAMPPSQIEMCGPCREACGLETYHEKVVELHEYRKRWLRDSVQCLQRATRDLEMELELFK
ncbi:hypothetical protein JTE90_014801 [Oedothorax gibbosus]|uniref:Uncharacterized protein n=1 Tax=Oedothorax gibbosus TaxID=931172 RepID=A0AAV6TEX0_9ARAC|nr:hypothetical protein JTE90_014801 [Oedothorax gibbosus]